MTARRKTHSSEFKQMITAEVRTGKWTNAEIGLRHNINPSLVSSWSRGRQLGTRGVRTAASPSSKKAHSVALAIAATGRAVDKLNGRAVAADYPDGAPVVGALIKEVVQRLRTLGIEIQQIAVDGDHYDIRYTVKETGTL